MSQEDAQAQRNKGTTLKGEHQHLVDHSHWGAYQSCVLHIHTSVWMDLDPEHGAVTDRAIATHAHEYVHYLHSMGTMAGQYYLLLNLLLLRNLVGGSDQNGHFLGGHVLDGGNRSAAQQFLQAMQDIRGYRSPSLHRNGELLQPALKNWSFRAAARLPKRGLGIERVSVSVSAEQPGGRILHGNFDVGYSFVTEGVAYQIDREIRRMQGMASAVLDDDVSYFPYLAYGDLVDQWVGRKTSPRERILIGNAALGRPAVGPGMQKACKVVRKGKRPAEVALKRMLSEANDASNHCALTLREVVRTTGTGHIVTKGLDSYLELVDRANFCRQHLKAPELLFLESPLDVPGYQSVLANLLDCMVLQKKPEDKVQITWIGPNQVAKNEDQASQIAAVQSAFHFNHLHHLSEGEIASTASLTAKPCPYLAACGVEVPEDQKKFCSAMPWMMSLNAHSGNKVCWYSAGVKALSGPHAPPSDSTLGLAALLI